MGKVIEFKKGERFGRLTIIRRVENDRHKKARYLCNCSCGNQTVANSSQIKSGKTRSCGCYFRFKRELATAKQFIDLEGRRFGRLKVEEMSFRRGNIVYWLCRCKCGQIKIANGQNLRCGVTTHCGCQAGRKISRFVKTRKRDHKGRLLPNSPQIKFWEG